MNFFEASGLRPGRAICYSGFRDGQQPGGIHPSAREIREDLMLLQPDWSYLRLYDCDPHAEETLRIIDGEGLDFKVMLGAYIEAEENNPDCPWGGGIYTSEQLKKNRDRNLRKIHQLIGLGQKYPGIIFSLSVGNEACVEWTDHAVPVDQVIHYAQTVKKQSTLPVTFCENYLPWLSRLEPLAAVLDFISIHSYPVWEYKNIDEAMAYTISNFESVQQKYPGKPVVITEAGWATRSNGRGILPENASEVNQAIYFRELMHWAGKERILCFYFEAFDEAWKGSSHPLEPEKHWGLYYADRTPKPVIAGKHPA